MYNIINFIKRSYKLILIFLIALVAALSYILSTRNDSRSELIEELNESTVEEVEGNISISNKITIDIKGEIKKPGVYELEEGSRVIDAIKESGGLTKEADTSTINLSKKLEDSNVIIIYGKNKKEEKIENVIELQTIIEYIEKECSCPEIENNACINIEDVVIEKADGNQPNSLVNINTATKETLMTLQGIGESKAIDIINYRNETGPFKNIEEIKNVKGIGESIFEKIKEYITI